MDRLFWWLFKRATPDGCDEKRDDRYCGPLLLTAGFNFSTLKFVRVIKLGRHTLWLSVTYVPELEGIYDGYSADATTHFNLKGS